MPPVVLRFLTFVGCFALGKAATSSKTVNFEKRLLKNQVLEDSAEYIEKIDKVNGAPSVSILKTLPYRLLILRLLESNTQLIASITENASGSSSFLNLLDDFEQKLEDFYLGSFLTAEDSAELNKTVVSTGYLHLFYNKLDLVNKSLEAVEAVLKTEAAAKYAQVASGPVVGPKPADTNLENVLVQPEAALKKQQIQAATVTTVAPKGSSSQVKNVYTLDEVDEMIKVKNSSENTIHEKRMLWLGLGLGVGLPVLFAIVIAVLIKTDRLTWNKSKSNFVHQV